MACAKQMSKSTGANYMFVDNMADVTVALTEIRRHDLLAVDCKGHKLGGGRSGDLTIIVVATPIQVFIFDVQKLQENVFDNGLRAILEDETKEKLMFDCRRDADNLWHQQKVQLSGVLDVQLLEVMYRRRKVFEIEEGSRRCSRTGEVQLLNGIRKCIEVYVKDQTMVESKLRCQRQVIGDSHVWKTRPLSENLKKYCCVDTSALFILYEKLKGKGKNKCRLRIASDRYADTFRCLTKRVYGIYETHAFLPLDIIPEPGDAFEFPEATTKCIGCLRLFPVDEFSKNQLRNKHRYCRVCKKAETYASTKPISMSGFDKKLRNK
ncbi:piRNA biogenesis protein EXD1-like [Ylistrum balloti]|uniref:piRNA biogenesis protein EXD1-like n=1 Tax=Ylistrum balloti TaxID=509963 RepID=UPI00290596B5|nr:piRNA biogenesis protein EXD1-like [Ylistrum balloti]